MISGIQGNTNISSDMMLQMREKMFTKTDANGDGQIDKTEMEAFASQMAERTGREVDSEDIFQQGDTDGDGVLSRDEFMALRPPGPKNMNKSSEEMQQMQAELFASIDQNGDGGIDKAEMKNFASKMAPRTGQPDDTEELFVVGDTNGDGILSEEEFIAMKPPKPPSAETGYSFQAGSQDTLGAELTGNLLDLLS